MGQAGDTMAPWKSKSKSRAAQDALSKQQAELQAVMVDLEGTSLCHVSEADSLASKLQQKDQVRYGPLRCSRANERTVVLREMNAMDKLDSVACVVDRAGNTGLRALPCGFSACPAYG